MTRAALTETASECESLGDWDNVGGKGWAMLRIVVDIEGE
jgi:hypothetical protein